MIRIYLQSNVIHKPFLFFISLLISSSLFAQLFPAKKYPKGYFIYPIEARRSLSANFGELRANHYHMGLDCRSDQAENKPVMAAADGYVARIGVAPFGFGRVLYINHPNGMTTVYGHLNDLNPQLEKYLKEQQYLKESWAINLEPDPSQFPVKKGQLIAKSGNTGGSQGPHLHFEIRDTKTDKVLNPLLFDMPLPDNVPPTLVHLYMFDRCLSTYNQSPKQIPIQKTATGYSAIQKIIPIHTDKVSFGLTANDKQSGSTNPNGIYEAIIYVDGKPISGFQLDSISYDETRYLNAHIDYKTKSTGGPYIQHLSRLPGYPEGVYRDFDGDGVIDLLDNKVHAVRVEVKDANGNTSVLNFNIQKGLIKETAAMGDSANFYQKRSFLPGFVNVYEEPEFQVILSPNALYDSVTFKPSKKVLPGAEIFSATHSVLNGLVPSHDLFTVKIKPTKNIPDSLKGKVLMRRRTGSRTEVSTTTIEEDKYVARFRTFGDFELIVDNVPPVINSNFLNNAVLTNSRSIIITPKDNNDEIINFRAELDGKWLRFTNDKGRNFIYQFDEKCGPGSHVLKITVEDLAGNKTERILNFTR